MHASPGSSRLAVAGDRVFDARAGAWADGTVVLVEDGVIAGITRSAPDGWLALEMPGTSLLPGLIDAHTHVLLRNSWNELELARQMVEENPGHRAPPAAAQRWPPSRARGQRRSVTPKAGTARPPSRPPALPGSVPPPAGPAGRPRPCCQPTSRADTTGPLQCVTVIRHHRAVRDAAAAHVAVTSDQDAVKAAKVKHRSSSVAGTCSRSAAATSPNNENRSHRFSSRLYRKRRECPRLRNLGLITLREDRSADLDIPIA